MVEAASHWDGECYGANSAVQFGIALEALAAHPYRGDERVLDIGCGDGKLSAELVRRVPRGSVVAVDNSESMLRQARTTFGAESRLSFKLAAAETLPFSAEFELAFSAFCLQWVPDKAAAFRALARSLKPQGRAILLMPFRSPEIAAARHELTQLARWRRYFRGYRDPTETLEDLDYAGYALAAGLAVRSSLVASTVAGFESLARFTGFLTALTPQLVRLPDAAAREDFMDELVARYVARVPPRRGEAATYVYVCANQVADAPA